MTRTRKKPTERLAPVTDEVLDQFGPATGMSMDDLDAATRRLKQALVERMLGGEQPDAAPNHRHGTSPKTVVTDDGPVAIAVPRDRAGTFAPGLIPKQARRLAGCDDKVVARYARGRPPREIQKFLEEVYPATTLQPCLVHLIRRSLDLVGWKDRPALARALRAIYTAQWTTKAARHWRETGHQFAILFGIAFRGARRKMRTVNAVVATGTDQPATRPPGRGPLEPEARDAVGKPFP